MKKRPEEILREWMAAVNKCDVEHVLSLYSPAAVLIPTFSNRLLSKPESIREYFVRLCEREELSLALHEKTLAVQPASDDIYSLYGIYCWRFAIEGEMLNFEARFCYMLNAASPTPIIHHHSSQIPRMI